ncbi:phage tail length tape measure family protein [Pluralibacter gergoviae]|uniref:phage tail length tape measure family protein n=1 Tax=Pluralibacter gergoviae TaxID=61647 RepID=UPI0007DAD134|nr:phage tail length tape measure family protein [Pluralibacter gergoviae]SUB71782.1 chromosome segregation protein SMC [Pluralibacter gergoviae]
MAENSAGSIVYTVSADIEPLLVGGKLAADALDKFDRSAQSSSKGVDSLDKSANQAGGAFSELAGYANSMDNQLKKLNTNVNGIVRAMEEARTGTGSAASEFNRVESIIEALGNQIAVLDEAQENGARSAAILAAQLRAGSKATDEEKQKIGELTGRLYDMKTGVDTGAKSHGNWKNTMQQAGYQVQDFIVQVQGGQSALVAFAQQGSQLAGAFGPGGAVLGAVIALGSVIAGTLITSLNGGKNAMDALKDAAEAMDKVITVSQNGVAALSDKYALLARTNAEAATILRNQALIEYNAAVQKIPKSINDASSSIITFTDKIRTSFSTGEASIDSFNKNLSDVGATSTDFAKAMEQARSAGARFVVQSNSIQSTVQALADKFGISEQAAFKLSKQLSDVANNPTPEALQKLVIELQNTHSASKDGAAAIVTFLGPLTELVRVAGEAQINLAGMKKEVDNLTAGQKNLIQQSERSLALSKLQGEARARLQAQYAAEDAGFAKDDPHTKKMQDDAAATYKNTQAQKELKSEQKKGATQAESISQKLANLKQQSELAAGSTKELSREQAILNAQQSLGKGATQEQIALAGKYAAAKWDTANAIKAQAAAEKLLPEARENASYKQDVDALNTALQAKKITQQQYNQTSEQLEQQHQANLAKIRAQQVVTPQQSAAGEVDPVQRLQNQHAQELALIQQFEQQGVIAHQNALALRAAADTQYEQQRIAAQWEILSQQSLGYNMLTSAVDSFGGNASNVITGLLTRSMDLNEALASIGRTVLNSVVNSIVQMGVEAMKNYIIGQTLGGAAVASSVGMAATTASAWAPAAAMASLATLGANSAPASAGIISTVGVAKGMAIAGGRKNGGPVSAGSMYQVGEGGKPEIYRASTGKQYMIPGDNGKVISNREMQSGGGVNVKINVVNQSTGAKVADANGYMQDGSAVVDLLLTDIESGGPFSSQMQNTFGLRRQANGAY